MKEILWIKKILSYKNTIFNCIAIGKFLSHLQFLFFLRNWCLFCVHQFFGYL